MKIQRPSYEIWLQKPGELGIYQQIERAGRVCYKSENNTTVNSAKPFVDRMVQSEHFAKLEHGTVYLVCKQGELPCVRGRSPNLNNPCDTPWHRAPSGRV